MCHNTIMFKNSKWVLNKKKYNYFIVHNIYIYNFSSFFIFLYEFSAFSNLKSVSFYIGGLPASKYELLVLANAEWSPSLNEASQICILLWNGSNSRIRRFFFFLVGNLHYIKMFLFQQIEHFLVYMLAIT